MFPARWERLTDIALSGLLDKAYLFAITENAAWLWAPRTISTLLLRELSQSSVQENPGAQKCLFGVCPSLTSGMGRLSVRIEF